ncbi:MAG: hypothetical protein FWH38_03770 [Treponema sp.]|nr:hypothetical protein [Treponema sp.]
MTKIGIFSLAAICSLMMLSSCSELFDISGNIANSNLDNIGENSFYARNMSTGLYYKVDAEILAEGSKCVIWAQKRSGVTKELAREIAGKYDTVIRKKIVDEFSMENFTVLVKSEGKEYAFDDILDYANFLAGRDDKKLTVLLLDIKDDYKNKGEDSYVAGYFFGGNFYRKGNIGGGIYSNGRDMIYVDTDPGLKSDREQTYATFAHELQHLINYVTSLLVRNGSFMDTWVDEGLSSQAEYLYYESNPSDRTEWYSRDIRGTIAKGNNFFVWGNHAEEKLAILDDYATVYLFFRWLYLQAYAQNKTGIFYQIETSDSNDYRAVTEVAKIVNSEWGRWDALLMAWLAANYYPESSFGYAGDSGLQKFITRKPIAGTSVSLYPGEGVYSVMRAPYTPGASGANIRYAGLAGTLSGITAAPPYAGEVLLTFNANTSNAASVKPETGYLTGNPPPVSRSVGEGAQAEKIKGPYVMDARDVLGRNGEYEFE